jgi:hypothetical protein
MDVFNGGSLTAEDMESGLPSIITLVSSEEHFKKSENSVPFKLSLN